MKGLRLMLIALLISAMIFPTGGVMAETEISEMTEEQIVYKALSYEVIADEVHYAITQNIDLSAVAEKIGTEVTIAWESSDESVITDDGVVTRDRYRNNNATLTATIGTGKSALTKSFDFTVLSSVTNIYSSDTFYHPEYEGQLISDAVSHWGFTRTTTLENEGMKTVIVKDNGETTNYYTKGYRTGTYTGVHYTKHVFDEKRNGELTWETDIYFDNTIPSQLYFIEFYGDYKVGQYVDSVQIADLRLQFYADAKPYVFARYYDGENIKSTHGSNSRDVIKENTWARLKIDINTDTQTWDATIDGVPYVTDVPFYEKNRANIVRQDFLGVTHMQYGPFRTYTEGNGICLDNVSLRDNNHIYSENADSYEFADKIDISLLTNEEADSISQKMDLSLSSLQSEMNSKDISVTWESSDSSVLSVSGDTAKPHREKLPRNVILTANIIQGESTHSVKKDFNLTVMPDDDYIRVYEVYRNLTEESFTTEPANAISQDLDFGVSYSGIDIGFTTSDEYIISSTGSVTRGDGNKPCEITVTITDTSNDTTMMKSLNYTVLDEKQYVYYSTNFAYPELDGEAVTELDNWTYYGSDPTKTSRFTSTIVKDGSNYLLESVRGDANVEDVTFNSLTLTEAAKGNVTMSTKMKFVHDKDPGMYVFYIFGQYMDGGTKKSMQCGEIRFDYDQSRAFIVHKEGDKIFSDIVYILPEIGEWFDFTFEFDILSQGYNIYINGEQYNTHTVPFYNAFSSTEAMQTCIGINELRYNTYRYTSDNAIYTDGVSITGERYLQADFELYENGERVKEIKYIDGFEGNTYNITAKIVNDTGSEKKFDLYVAVYDGYKMVSVKKKSSLVMADGEFKSETLTGIEIPRNLKNVDIKVFMVGPSLSPVEMNACISADVISDYESEIYYFEETGRTMHYVDLHGRIAYKPYFNAQCWSADSRKLYFQGKDYTIYEYNMDENTIRFIAEGRDYYGIVTTPQNKLIYSSKQGRIIEMDCDTYEKRIAGELPEGQTNGGSQLTVSNDGKYLCVIWTDTIGGMENDDTLKNRRFPVLDMETGIWNTDNYFGFEDAPPYNTGMNPAYPNLILFNHCAVEGDTFDRNWVIDTSTGIATNRFKQKGYSATETGEVISHETWSYDGELLYIDKALSSKIAMGGVMSFDKDGNNRRHINDDYSYLHLGVNPVNPRFVVSDTGYGTSKTSDIVVVDCHSGKSYKLATTNQRGDDSVAHSHPAFTPDGQKVYFGVFNGDFTSAGIGFIDVSDIVNQPDYMEIVELSESCNAESYKGMSHEVTVTTLDGRGGYNIENGNYMRVNYTGAETSNVKADIEITYFADGGQGELGYFVWTEDPETHNSLDEHKYVFDKLNTGKWETITISFDDINLENMGHMGSDFYLKGIDSDLAVRFVSVIEK